MKSFSEAIKAIKEGKLVARQGWNGKGMFIFMRPADELSVDMIVHKVKSVPQALKDYYSEQTMTVGTNLEGDSTIKFTAYLCMKAADGSIVNGWLASQTDILAEDWVIVE